MAQRRTARAAQSYANHRRFHPLYHYVALPLLLGNVGVAAWHAARHPSGASAWTLVVAIALATGLVVSRAQTLTVQNRVVRLEQWLRLGALLPADLKGRVGELSLGQLVGLRFASDAELPDLVRRCLAGELRTADQVKREVKDWQPDLVRA